MKCKWHLCENELTGKKRVFCSRNCNLKFNVTAKRRKNKIELIKHFGGKCIRCGYIGSASVYDFHHPAGTKEFSIGKGDTKSFAKLLVEAEKCELLCANCHREEHALY